MRIVSTRITFLLLFVIIPLHLSGQEKLKGNKIVVTEDRNISDFNKIDIKDKIEVIINQGNNKSVLVETDENIQFAVLTEVKDNTLYIQLSKKIIKKKTLKVYVSVDDFINEISTNGYANVRSDGTLNLDQITINASGDSKISMDIKCSNFTLLNNKSANLHLSIDTNKAIINGNNTGKAKLNIIAENIEVLSQGNSITELTGKTVELIVNAENKSKLKASMLECDDTTIIVSDVSDVHVNSKNSMSISAINSAEIYIYNNPKITIEKFTDKAILRKK